MAFPFGGHPTLADYIGQARHDHKATAQSIVAQDDDGNAVTAHRIQLPNGVSTIVVGIEQTDHLTPTDIGSLDRRLGIQSPYFSVDPSD